MQPPRCTYICVSLTVIGVAIDGCATVNPRPDYDRTAQQVEAATGQGFHYRPDGDQQENRRHVDALLRDGLTASEAAEVCLLNNRKLQAMLYDVGAARADVVQAGLLSNPTLSLGLGFPDEGGLANFDAALAQNFADLWQIPVRKGIAERVHTGIFLQ